MKILLWPHPALKKPAVAVQPAEFGTTDLGKQLSEMRQAMKLAGGIGLAANQVGLDRRMLVAHAQGHIQSFINPRIVKFTGEWKTMDEGCLSLPGIVIPHRRNTEVLFEHQDFQTGAIIVDVVGGQLAHILQHEIEHLDGKVMIDVLPSGQRDKIRAYMRTVKR
jgi:peptide deformylase